MSVTYPRATAEAVAQACRPLLYRLWSMLDDGELFVAGGGINQAAVMFSSVQSRPTKAANSAILSSRSESIEYAEHAGFSSAKYL